MSMNPWGPGQNPASYPNQWQHYGPPGSPQYRPPSKQMNRYKVGAIVCWVVSAWFAIQSIQIINIMSGFWGPFVGTRGDVELLYTLVVTGATGVGGWYLWRKGNSAVPARTSGPQTAPPGPGPSEPKPYPADPGWKPDPWGGAGQWRYWDGQCWTPHYRVTR